MKRDLDVMRNLPLKAGSADTPIWIAPGQNPDDDTAGHLLLPEDEGLPVRHPKIIDRRRLTAGGRQFFEFFLKKHF